MTTGFGGQCIPARPQSVKEQPFSPPSRPAPTERGERLSETAPFNLAFAKPPPHARRLSNGPTVYWRAEGRTKRDRSCCARFVKGRSGSEDRCDDLRRPQRSARLPRGIMGGRPGAKRGRADDRCQLHHLGSLCRGRGVRRPRHSLPGASRVRKGVTETSISVEMGASKTVPPASTREEASSLQRPTRQRTPSRGAR